MPFQVSPGVNVSEIDLTTIVPAVSSTFGGVAGVFKWGPIEERVLVSSEDELVSVFGKPTANNFETFYTAANFLAYGNQLYVVRANSTTTYNAIANTDVPSSTNVSIKNINDYNKQKTSLELTANANTPFAAKFAGDLGNSLKISICAREADYESSVVAYSGANGNVKASNTYFSFTVPNGTNQGTFFYQHLQNTFAANCTTSVKSNLNVGDVILAGDSTVGTQYLTIKSIGDILDVTALVNPAVPSSNTFTKSYLNVTFDEVFRQKDNFITSGMLNSGTGYGTELFPKYWEYHTLVDTAPGVSNYVSARNANTSVRDEVHIVIVDEEGKFTGIPGEILEVWPNLSVATDAKGEQGGSIYYRDVLNQSSRYVWSLTDYMGGDKKSRDTSLTTTLAGNKNLSFNYGTDGPSEVDIPVAKILTAYDLFKSTEDVDVSLILGGKERDIGAGVIGNYIIDNICEYRKDCVAFISPNQTATVNNPGNELNNLIAYRNDSLVTSTSYAVLDSGYKYQYDKYNDVYRWVPLNGDIAGLCVRTDNIRDPWWSPAGFNRGMIKNVVKLAFNPDKAERDVMYRSGINPVVTFPGQGTLLYGDKTLLARPSAFDRINVRRLFIVLEKAIAIAAKSTLFEFNDDFTRAAFRNLVEPYLRDIQGRRGIYDFRVICDTTNNTPEVIDRNEFRGDIYIKPARSINFIQLNFVAVRTGVEFEEIVGKF